MDRVQGFDPAPAGPRFYQFEKDNPRMEGAFATIPDSMCAGTPRGGLHWALNADAHISESSTAEFCTSNSASAPKVPPVLPCLFRNSVSAASLTQARWRYYCAVFLGGEWGKIDFTPMGHVLCVFYCVCLGRTATWQARGRVQSTRRRAPAAGSLDRWTAEKGHSI